MPCSVVLGWMFWFLVDGLFLLSKLYTLSLYRFRCLFFSWCLCGSTSGDTVLLCARVFEATIKLNSLGVWTGGYVHRSSRISLLGPSPSSCAFTVDHSVDFAVG